MPDQLNKQALVNLLIDSPLREPIKINLIDIVNNTTDPDLPKVFPTIVKELEIFQKATERRMKLAEETITKLGGTSTGSDTPSVPPMSDFAAPAPAETTSAAPNATPPLAVPPLDLPPMPTSPVADNPTPTPSETPTADTPALPPLPPMPEPTTPPASSMPSIDSSTPLPTPTPLGGSTPAPQADEDALAEIQKELDSLKTSAADEVAVAANPTPAPNPVPQT